MKAKKDIIIYPNPEIDDLDKGNTDNSTLKSPKNSQDIYNFSNFFKTLDELTDEKEEEITQTTKNDEEIKEEEEVNQEEKPEEINEEEKEKQKIKSPLLYKNTKTLVQKLKYHKCNQNFTSSLDKLNEEEFNLFFEKINPFISEIMCANYGNYFFQFYIKKLGTLQKIKLLLSIKDNFYEICANKYGTHSIQSIIRNFEHPSEIEIFENILFQSINYIITNENAYHIIIEMIICFICIFRII